MKKYKHSRLCRDTKSAEHPGKGQEYFGSFSRLLLDAIRIELLPTGFIPVPYLAVKYAGGSKSVALGHGVLAEFNDGGKLLRKNLVTIDRFGG